MLEEMADAILADVLIPGAHVCPHADGDGSQMRDGLAHDTDAIVEDCLAVNGCSLA
jgi:hypothetical protein